MWAITAWLPLLLPKLLLCPRGHNCIGHNYICHIYVGYQDHCLTSLCHMGRNYIGHNHADHNCFGYQCKPSVFQLCSCVHSRAVAALTPPNSCQNFLSCSRVQEAAPADSRAGIHTDRSRSTRKGQHRLHIGLYSYGQSSYGLLRHSLCVYGLCSYGCS